MHYDQSYWPFLTSESCSRDPVVQSPFWNEKEYIRAVWRITWMQLRSERSLPQMAPPQMMVSLWSSRGARSIQCDDIPCPIHPHFTSWAWRKMNKGSTDQMWHTDAEVTRLKGQKLNKSTNKKWKLEEVIYLWLHCLPLPVSSVWSPSQRIHMCPLTSFFIH